MLKFLQHIPLSTKIIYASIFLYFTLTQFLILQKIKSNQTDKEVEHLKEYLTDSVNKLTTIAFSSAAFLRDIGKSSNEVDWVKEISFLKKRKKLKKTWKLKFQEEKRRMERPPQKLKKIIFYLWIVTLLLLSKYPL
jgi:hypothetical protein